LKLTNHQNSSKSPNNICNFITYVHLRMMYVLRLLTEGWQTVLIVTGEQCFGFHGVSLGSLHLGENFKEKICTNHRYYCGTVSQLQMTFAQYAVRFCQLLIETRYVLHSPEQKFLFPVSAERLL